MQRNSNNGLIGNGTGLSLRCSAFADGRVRAVCLRVVTRSTDTSQCVSSSSRRRIATARRIAAARRIAIAGRSIANGCGSSIATHELCARRRREAGSG